jgi:RimJ/RimL family protein N-acetyltransferase
MPTSERLILRQWRAADLAPFAEMNADAEVMAFMARRLDRAESDVLAGRLKAHIERHGFGFWAAELAANGAFIGFVGLVNVEFEAHFTPAVEVGWRLARPYWGQGYASDAARAALGHGFSPLGLDEIVACTVPDNRASRRVMERLGMAHDAADDFGHPLLPPEHRLHRHVLYRLARAAYAGAPGPSGWP